MDWEEIIISALKNGEDLNKSLKKAAKVAPKEIALLLQNFPEKIHDISKIHTCPKVISLLYFHLFSIEGEYFDEYPPEEQMTILRNSIDASLRASSVTEALGEKRLQAHYLRTAAGAFFECGEFSEAEKYYKKALEIERDLAGKSPEPSNPYIAMILNSLGNIYWTTHKFNEAESLYTAALDMYRNLAEETPDAYTPHVAAILTNLGTLYKDTRKFSEAENMYKKALQMRRDLAKKNPDTYTGDVAMTLNSLGSLYWTVHEFDEAETVYRKALDQYRKLAQKSPEQYTPDLAVALSNLGVLYWNTQQLDKAETVYTEALQIKRDLAEKNPDRYMCDVAMILNNLGILYSTTQQFNKAETLLTEALHIKRDLAEKNPDVYNQDISRTLTNLGIIYRNIQKFDEAEKAYTEALQIRRDLAEKNPDVYLPQVSATLANLGALYSYTHTFTEAENMYTEALTIYRGLAEGALNIYAPYVAGVLNNLGKFYKDIQKFNEAEKAYTEALQIRKTFSKKNPDVYTADLAETLNNLGILYKNIQKIDEAEKYLKESLEKYRILEKKNPVAYVPHVAMTLTNLGNFYRTAGTYSPQKLAEAAFMYTEALDMYRKLAAENPEAYTGYVAGVLNNLGILYHDRKKFSQAREAFTEAFELYKKIPSWFYATSVIRNISKMESSAKILDDSRKLLELAVLFSGEKKYTYAQKGMNEDTYRGLLEQDIDLFGVLEALRDPELLSIPWNQVLPQGELERAQKDVEVQKAVVDRVLEGKVVCWEPVLGPLEDVLFVYVQNLQDHVLFFVVNSDGTQKFTCKREFFTMGVKLLYLLKFQLIAAGKPRCMEYVKKFEELAEEWHEILPQGLKRLIQEKCYIVFSPDSYCSCLPLEALPVDGEPLCMGKTVVRAASVHQVLSLMKREPQFDSSLLVGNPWPGGQRKLLYSLPSGLKRFRISFLGGAEEEVNMLTEKLPHAAVLLGKEATGEKFLSEISKHSLERKKLLKKL